MTKEEALKILDWIPTKGEEVDALEMAIKALENQKHAHWKKSKTTEGMIYCSLCHYNTYVYKTPFCALCGARMDEEEGESDGTK